MSKKLSLLILTIEDRKHFYERLMACLTPQLTDAVEVLTLKDNGERTIGEKRNELMLQTAASHLAFIDDDDLVAPDYCLLILKALESNPDCVGFRSSRFVNGEYEGEARHHLKYRELKSGLCFFGGRIRTFYQRPINHLNPVRRSIALSCGFPDINIGEDTSYAFRIMPHLKTCVHIEKSLYFYEWRTPETRGELINKDCSKFVRGGRFD